MKRHNPEGEIERTQSRRSFFSSVSHGLKGAAIASLLGNDYPALASPSRRVYDLSERAAHFEPKAKSVIQLFMNGGPSQVDLFDPKPALEKYAGQPPGRDLASEVRAVREAGGLMPSPFKFAKHGESGIELSEILRTWPRASTTSHSFARCGLPTWPTRRRYF